MAALAFYGLWRLVSEAPEAIEQLSVEPTAVATEATGAPSVEAPVVDVKELRR